MQKGNSILQKDYQEKAKRKIGECKEENSRMQRGN